VCLEVVNNFANAAAEIRDAFFRQYFLSIVQDVFFVLTDADHKSGFKLQIVLLARMYQLVEMNVIQTPLFDGGSHPTNTAFLKEYTANLLKTAFPHVQPCVLNYVLLCTPLIHFDLSAHVLTFVNALSENHNDINRFKLALRDFLIQLKEFSASDNAELFLEEKEAELQ
jgi:exportin-1